MLNMKLTGNAARPTLRAICFAILNAKTSSTRFFKSFGMRGLWSNGRPIAKKRLPHSRLRPPHRLPFPRSKRSRLPRLLNTFQAQAPGLFQPNPIRICRRAGQAQPICARGKRKNASTPKSSVLLLALLYWRPSLPFLLAALEIQIPIQKKIHPKRLHCQRVPEHRQNLHPARAPAFPHGWCPPPSPKAWPMSHGTANCLSIPTIQISTKALSRGLSRSAGDRPKTICPPSGRLKTRTAPTNPSAKTSASRQQKRLKNQFNRQALKPSPIQNPKPGKHFPPAKTTEDA